MKPPAFQFYADDFLAGTFDMTPHDVGCYIRLLCFQWNRGSLPVQPDRVDRLAGGSVPQEVLAKFVDDGNGGMVNLRLERERKKQLAYRDLQRKKGIASGQARLNRGSTAVHSGSNRESTAVEPSVNSPSPSPSGKERERDSEIPSLQECLTEASMRGYTPECAEWFFHTYDSIGWMLGGHRICKWRSLMARTAKKWRANGNRPDRPNHPDILAPSVVENLTRMIEEKRNQLPRMSPEDRAETQKTIDAALQRLSAHQSASQPTQNRPKATQEA